MINNQPPDQLAPSVITASLEVHSIFDTIQGEGPFSGVPAVFVRLAGCNLRCPLCDTDYTSVREVMEIDTIVKTVAALAFPSRLVVITGGEPFRQNIRPLVVELLLKQFKVQIETNGTTIVGDYAYLHRKDVTVVCSPKTGTVNKKLLPYIDAYKYVVEEGNWSPIDGLPFTSLGHPASPQLARPHQGFKGTIYVQPIDKHGQGLRTLQLETAKKICMKYGYTLCLQIHKLIGVE